MYHRGFDREIPFLDGIFDLEFGWMTGMVYRLKKDALLARATISVWSRSGR